MYRSVPDKDYFHFFRKGEPDGKKIVSFLRYKKEDLVGTYFNDHDKTMLWFQVPNPLLGDMSPRDAIRVGRFKKLLKFIQTTLDENTRSR